MLLFLKFYSWEGCPSFICLSHDNSKPLFEGCATPRRLSELTDTDYNDDDDDENEKQKRSFYESARRARKHDCRLTGLRLKPYIPKELCAVHPCGGIPSKLKQLSENSQNVYIWKQFGIASPCLPSLT